MSICKEQQISRGWSWDMSALTGMHGSGSGEVAAGGPPPQASVLPQVHKNEKPSLVVLKYLDGITKRVSKISDA